MARKEVNEIVKPMGLTDQETGEHYDLEFSRSSVVFTNKQGFKISELYDNMEEMLPILFYGAFRMHHQNVSRQKTDKILFEDLGGLSDAALERLIALYAAPRKALIREEGEDEVKNSKMTVEL